MLGRSSDEAPPAESAASCDWTFSRSDTTPASSGGEGFRLAQEQKNSGHSFVRQQCSTLVWCNQRPIKDAHTPCVTPRLGTYSSSAVDWWQDMLADLHTGWCESEGEIHLGLSSESERYTAYTPSGGDGLRLATRKKLSGCCLCVSLNKGLST